MKLGEIDKDLKPIKQNLFLCKPDKKTIKKITEAYDISYSTKLGTVNEISFKIPTIIEKDRVPIDNPNIEGIKHRYLFKLTHGSSTEYFQFNERNKAFSDDEYVEYKAYSLGIQLTDKNVRAFKAESKNLTAIATEVLQRSKWKVGYVDSEFDLKYRSHEVPSQSLLQVIYELAQKFNAVIKWDTVNLKINFYKPENVGLNKGLRLKEGKYLESFNLSSDSTEAITRLKLYGSEGLTIRRLSPTGSVYIEDFSWYMYPFERDINGQVITESDHMENDLCIALEDYQALLVAKQGEFDTLTTQLKTKQDEIQQEMQLLSVMQSDLILIYDERDLLNSQFLDGTLAHQEVIGRMVAKETEVNNKISFIGTLITQEESIETQILTLRSIVAIENNLTPTQILELDDFIIEKEHTNDTIIDEEDLLQEGIEVFNIMREPKIQLNVDIVNFLTMIECQNDWDKLVLGDTISAKHNRLGVDIKAKIIEINYNFESESVSLVIANEKDIADNDAKFMELLYNAGNTSTIVNMDKYKWDLSEENNGMINEIINNKWDAIKNAVVGGYDQQISISERGVIVKSLENPNVWLVIQNGMLAITNDGGNSWKHAITSEGIVGERIYGKIIMGVNLAIEDESGIMKFRGSRGQIFDRNGVEQMRLGLVTDSPASECFGMLLDNGKHRVHVTSCDGFMIEKKVGTAWVKKMYADLDGNFWVEDFTAANLFAKNLRIEDNDGYFSFQGNKGTISDGVKPVMWLGYIPTEIPDDFGVIVKDDNNTKIFMTRNRGFAIDVGGVNKFSVDLGGNIYAQDIIAHNLKIVNGELGAKIILDETTGITINGNAGQVIKLNANEGISIDVNSDRRFWIGTDGLLYARRLVVLNDEFNEAILDQVTGSYISDLTVNKLRTLNSNAPQDHVFIKDNYIKLITGEGATTDIAKFILTLAGTGFGGYPHSTWGAGDVIGNDRGFIYKDNLGFWFDYVAGDGLMRRISMQDQQIDSILLDTPHKMRLHAGQAVRIEANAGNFIEISPTGITIRGTRVDIN